MIGESVSADALRVRRRVGAHEGDDAKQTFERICRDLKSRDGTVWVQVCG